MIERYFSHGIRIALHQKEPNLVVGGGGAAWDHSGSVHVVENRANHEIGKAR